MGGITALGEDWPVIREHLAAGRTAVRRMAEWERYDGPEYAPRRAAHRL